MMSQRRVDAPPPTIPKFAAYLWVWFCELSGARTSNGYGANPITFPDIAAWSQVMGLRPTPWEVSVIRRMDIAVLSVLNKASGSGEVPVTDTKGVSSIFSGLKARASEVFK